MDKKGVIGLFLIAIILIVWQFVAGPSADEIRAIEARKDSVKQAEEQIKKAELAEDEAVIAEAPKFIINGVTTDDSTGIDSASSALLTAKFGDLAYSATGTEAETVIETPLIRAVFSNMGGRLVSVELLQYHTHDTTPLFLFEKDSSLLDFRFMFQNRQLAASQLFFEPTVIEAQSETDSTVVIFKAYAGAKGRYIEQRYTFFPDDYMTRYDINFVGMPDVVAENNQAIHINWLITSPRKEKGITLEQQKTTFFYRTNDGDVDYLSESKNDEELVELPMQWVAFKEQFFTVDLISDNNFKAGTSKLIVRGKENSPRFVRTMAADLHTEMTNGGVPLQLYLGPAKYKILKKYDIRLDKQIDLGWGIFGWVNRFLVIPIFDFLDGFHISYGIIILILTIFIKLILFPITYKTYMSSAKMKALKPEIEEINEKYKNRDNTEKQQAIMALYRETGVNPMAGCIPMLIQMPILYAMFRFFPASIELRQQGFLWAEDLSTYDVILDLSQWGIHIPMYGDHVSGFTLLMAISMIFYTKNNSQMNMGATGGAQAQQMKIMMWFMPVMMMVFLNSYAAGLSLYYFTANMITMLQQWVIKKFFIDEEKIHAKLQANKTKPKKKSKLMARLEALQEQQNTKQNRQMRRKK